MRLKKKKISKKKIIMVVEFVLNDFAQRDFCSFRNQSVAQASVQNPGW